MKIDFCNHKIVGRKAYMTYGTHTFCVKCVMAMIHMFGALPNDGSIRGAQLARDICERTSFVNKQLRIELGEIKDPNPQQALRRIDEMIDEDMSNDQAP